MITLNKGLHTDGNELEQPQGTWRDATNMVYDKSKQILSTEFGQSYYDQNFPSKNLIGHCVIDDEVVLFFEDVAEDEIGIFDVRSGLYNKVYADSTVFNFVYPYRIKAKFYINGSGERIVIFTDELNPLRFINIDNPMILNAKNLNLMGNSIETIPSNVTASLRYSGSLPNGSYSFFYRFISKEGRPTNYVPLDKVLSVNASNDSISSTNAEETRPNEIGNKSIVLSFTEIDSDYEFIEIGTIATINEVTSARIITANLISTSTLSYRFSDYDSSGPSIDLAEVFVPYADYPIVKDIEIANDQLLIAGLRSESEINFQPNALDININYVVKYSSSDAFQRGLPTFVPGEVYAFYIVFLMNNGSLSKAFHIPGRNGRDTDTELVGGFEVGTKRYQVEDTHNVNVIASGINSNMSYWENQNELYPDTDDFISPNGRELKGTNVKHHRFPSMKAGFDNIQGATYTLNSENKSIPIYGIEVSDVIIPTEIASKVKGYYIAHSKRTINNQLVLGYSDYQFQGEVISSGTSDMVAQRDTFLPLVANAEMGAIAATDKRITINNNALRFSNFDLLFNKPRIAPKYVKREIRVEVELSGSEGTGNNADAKNSFTTGYAGVTTAVSETYLDFYKNSNPGHTSTWSNLDTEDEYKTIEKHQYVPANVKTDNVDNRLGDEHLFLFLDDANSEAWVDQGDTTLVAANTIRSYLCGLFQIQDNVYQNFYEQNNLVICNGSFIEITGQGSYSNTGLNDTFKYVGDNRIVRYAYVSHGPIDGTQDGYFIAAGYDSDATSETFTYKGVGSRCLKNILTYSTSDPELQYRDVGNNTDLFPNTGIIKDGILANYFIDSEIVLGYDKSINALNEYNAIVPFNTFEQLSDSHPFRIARSTIIQREEYRVNFEFLAANYYEMPNNKGEIVGINFFNNRLLVRHKNTVFVTNPPQSIQTSSGIATIGENDLFDIRPQEIITTDNGFAGSTDKFGCLVTEWGALFVDEQKGSVYLYANQLEEISKQGIHEDAERNLSVPFNYYPDDKNTTVTTFYWEDNKHLFVFNVLNDNLIKYKYQVGDYIYSKTTFTAGKIVKVELDGDVLNVYTDLRGVELTHAGYVHYKKIGDPNVGIRLGYDPELERLMVTRLDPYNINLYGLYKGFFRFGENPEEGAVYIRQQPVVYGSEGFSALGFDPANYTYSYYPDGRFKFWCSKHDYYPINYINSRNKLIYNKDNRVARFNDYNNKGSFLDVNYISSVSFIHNEQLNLAKKYLEMSFKSLARVGSNQLTKVQSTFDTIEFENDFQESGTITLVPFNDITTPYNIRSIHNNWNFRLIRDNSNHLMIDNYLKIKFTVSGQNVLYLYGYEISYNSVKNI